MTNVNKLKETVGEMIDQGMKNLHFSWAPDAAGLTLEERAGHMLQAIQSMQKYEALTVEEKMRLALKNLYVDVKYCMNCASYDRIAEWRDGGTKVPYEELVARLNKIWGRLDMTLLTLGNWIQREDRASLVKEVLEQHTINKSLDFHVEERFL